jgi:putative two-component system response regulator
MKDNDVSGNILIVDDNPNNLHLLASLLNKQRFKVRSVINGPMALTAVKTAPPDLILLDINMPEMDGYQVCKILKSEEAHRDIPIIFISALDELSDKLKALEVGGVDYITKPFQEKEVMARVNTHMALVNARQELVKLNRNQEIIITQQVEKISSYQLATIFALAKLADSRDHDTGAHLENTQILCKIFTERLSLFPQFQYIMDATYIKNLSAASALHDIGKVGIRDAILKKEGKLDADEFNEMKKHTTIGANALREVDEKFPDNELIRMGIRIAESHHEKWDGSGYPQGLAGEAIPLEARILALVDVYEALTSARPYKPAFSHEESRDIIVKSRGTHFDPVLVDGFLTIEDQFAQIKGNI